MEAKNSQSVTYGCMVIRRPSLIFMHGQLYVEFSRDRNADSVKVILADIDDGYYFTDYVVFCETIVLYIINFIMCFLIV